MHRPLRPFVATTAVALLVACGSDSPIGPRATPLNGTFTVGDLVTLNVNAVEDCTNPIIHVARVEAIGVKSLILVDTLNPKNGFSTADYERFAAKFDTLIYPIDVAAFGAPTDVDQNGRVGIIFTRVVNELTPAQSSSYVGGFTFSRDLFPKVGIPRAPDGCPSSNEGEYFYALAPDPAGQINGNVRTPGFVDSVTTAVLAHELQHLINGSRTLYVNLASEEFEEVWLDEGLAHIAEELLFYREAGLSPRTNIGFAAVGQSQRTRVAYNTDMSGNAGRYMRYLQNPANNSPYALNDSLGTRGATWSMLRYLADEKALNVVPSASPSLRRVGSGSVTVTGTGLGTTDYAAVVVNSATDPGAAPVSYTIRADNVLLSTAPSGQSPAASRSVLLDGAPVLQRDQAFEARLRGRERAMMPARRAAARSWFRATRAGSATGGLASRAAFDVVPSVSVDGDLWFRLVNNPQKGLVNLAAVFGDASVGVRNWSVTNQTDDASAGPAAEYLQPSWNWHNLYPNLGTGGNVYPLQITALTSTSIDAATVIRGGSRYYRFTVPTTGTATVTLDEPSHPVNSTLQLVVVRTR